MNEHADADDDARQIRQRPPRISDDLQDSSFHLFEKARLEKRFPFMAEGMIHVDFDVVALDVLRGIGEANVAVEVLRSVCADIGVVDEFLEKQLVIAVAALEAKNDVIRMFADF